MIGTAETRLVSVCGYITSDMVKFKVEIYHKKYARENYYKLFKEGKVCAEGSCPAKYTTRDIFNYWVRDDGKIETFKEVS